MKAIKFLSFCVLIGSFVACTKNNDGVKEKLEKALPSVEITSLGLLIQTPPFATTDVIQVTFGGAITKADSAAFDIAWYDVPASSSANPALVDSVHFKYWTQAAEASTGNNAISTTLLPTSYPNTQIFTGNLVYKLTKMAAGKSYTLKVYARTKDSKMATMSATKLITMK